MTENSVLEEWRVCNQTEEEREASRGWRGSYDNSKLVTQELTSFNLPIIPGTVPRWSWNSETGTSKVRNRYCWSKLFSVLPTWLKPENGTKSCSPPCDPVSQAWRTGWKCRFAIVWCLTGMLGSLCLLVLSSFLIYAAEQFVIRWHITD